VRLNDSSGNPTKLSNRWGFLDANASPERVWTLPVHPTDSHQPVLTLKSAHRGSHKTHRGHTTHPKTDIVVAVVARIVVAAGRTAILRIVVPRTAAQQLWLPAPCLL